MRNFDIVSIILYFIKYSLKNEITEVLLKVSQTISMQSSVMRNVALLINLLAFDLGYVFQ